MLISPVNVIAVSGKTVNSVFCYEEGILKIVGIIVTAIAVSYTHLDVYKRQVQN